MELSVCIQKIEEAARKEVSLHFPEEIIKFINFDCDSKSKISGYVSGMLQICLVDGFVVGPEYTNSYIVIPFGSYKNSVAMMEGISELRSEISRYMGVVERSGFLLSKEIQGSVNILLRVSEALDYTCKLCGCSKEELPFNEQTRNMIRVFQYDYYSNYSELVADIKKYVVENGRLPEGNSHMYLLYSNLGSMLDCLSSEDRETYLSVKELAQQKHIDKLISEVEDFCSINNRWYRDGESGSTLFWIYNYMNLGKMSRAQINRFNELYAKYVATYSEAEYTVMSYLNRTGYIAKAQYVFKDCRNLVPLPFDVAFWVGGKLCLIECNGRQHYEPVSCFGGKVGFESRKRNDEIKKKYCEENDIPLLVIPYTVDAEGIPSEIELFIEKVRRGNK